MGDFMGLIGVPYVLEVSGLEDLRDGELSVICGALGWGIRVLTSLPSS